MKVRFGFAGFRHGHIFSLFDRVGTDAATEVVACSEENAAAREGLASAGKVNITHTSHAAMLKDVPCDVIAIGDTYGSRGQIAIAALKAGKHVLSDKPICTRLDELDEIERLATENGLQVGCQLDLRDVANTRTLRRIIAEGTIGDVVTVNITAQHPLNLGVRPSWYFEPGVHGGTINDIGIHAFDIVPWLTGHRVEELLAARCWNAKAKEYPHFGDAAQLMARLGNGGGLVADFSYLAPTKTGASDENYWRITCHGLQGVASTFLASDHVRVASDHDEAVRQIPLDAAHPGKYLEDFLLCIQGRSSEAELTTQGVLTAAREALSAQAFADR